MPPRSYFALPWYKLIDVVTVIKFLDEADVDEVFRLGAFCFGIFVG
jgi:GDP-D-mannose dehydratase